MKAEWKLKAMTWISKGERCIYDGENNSDQHKNQKESANSNSKILYDPYPHLQFSVVVSVFDNESAKWSYRNVKERKRQENRGKRCYDPG